MLIRRNLAVFTISAVAACTPAVLPAQQQQNSRDRTAGNTMNNRGTRESRMEDMVRSRIYGSISLHGSDIDVKAHNHTVTLTGKVADQNAKDRAERIAQQVPGVYDVENKLAIDKPFVTSRRKDVPDDQLARNAAQAIGRELQANADQDWLYGWDVAKDDWEIEVDADGGVVTLSGDANSYSDMNRAVSAAAKVPGVKAVYNHMGLSFESRTNGYWDGFGYPYWRYGYPYYPYY